MTAVRDILFQVVDATACTVAVGLGLVVALGAIVCVFRGLARMSETLCRTGGRVALAGVGVLAIVCLLFAQKPSAQVSRVPIVPRAGQVRTTAVMPGLYELAAHPSSFTPGTGDVLRLTGIELTPSSVVLGASWPFAARDADGMLDILGCARLDDGAWMPLAWTRPPVSSPDFAVEVPAALLPDGAGTGTFFALGRSVDRDSDGDELSDREEAGWVETGAWIPDFDLSDGAVLFDGTDEGYAPNEIHVSLPFPVMLAGRISTNAVVCADGVVAFVSRGAEWETVLDWPWNWDLSDANYAPYCENHSVVAAYWDDLYFPSSGMIRTSVQAVDGFRWFVVEYADVTLDDVARVEDPPRATFQVAVCESDPRTVHVRYVSVPSAFDGSLAMIGAQGADGIPNFPVAYHQPGSVTNGMTFAYHFGTGSDPFLRDTDGDGLADDEEASLGTSPISADTDGDGLPDKWERDKGLDPLVADGPDGADGDPDGDGLPNAGEFLHGTDPKCADTDGDCLPDGGETGGITAMNALPWLAFDSAEDLTGVFTADASLSVSWPLPVPFVVQNHDVTNIVLGLAGVLLFPDGNASEGAALPPPHAFGRAFPADGFVLASYWHSELSVVSTPPSPTSVRIGTATHAGEGYILVEHANVYAALDAWRTNAISFQVAIPTSRTDRAFVRYRGIRGECMDGADVAVGLQGFAGRTLVSYCDRRPGRLCEDLSLQFLFGSGADPLVRDTDGDGLDDFVEAAAGTDPRRGDTDFDGMPDHWEVAYGLFPRDARDASMDVDADGLSNLDEYLNGCNPRVADSDGDGAPDGEEVAGSGNPCDPSDDGVPPPRDELRDMAFHLSGDYAAWTLNVRGVGPRDTRSLAATMPQPDRNGINPHWDLREGNSYLVSLTWLNCLGHEDDRHYSPWYCWGLEINGLPRECTFFVHSASRLPGQAETVVGEGWFAENGDGLLTSHVHMSEGDGEGVSGGGNVAEGLEAVLHVCKVESVRVCSPDSPEWAELEPSRVLLDDEPFRVQFEIVPEVPSLAICRQMFGNALTLRTSGTAPGGVSLPLDDAYTTLSSSDGRTVVRAEYPFGKLKEIRALPRQDNDGVAEMAWIDIVEDRPDTVQNLDDSRAFEQLGYAFRGKATTDPGQTLESEPPNSEQSESFFKAAGCETMQVSYGGAASARRQVMNQADFFYVSGHGGHASNMLQGRYTPAMLGDFWKRDLDCLIIAGCSLLDINDYNGNFQGADHLRSPGKEWEPTGPAVLLGYNYIAPGDRGGAPARIVGHWQQNRAARGDVDAWMDANAANRAWNACAIEKGVRYVYFRRLWGMKRRVSIPSSEW